MSCSFVSNLKFKVKWKIPLTILENEEKPKKAQNLSETSMASLALR